MAFNLLTWKELGPQKCHPALCYILVSPQPPGQSCEFMYSVSFSSRSSGPGLSLLSRTRAKPVQTLHCSSPWAINPQFHHYRPKGK